MGRPSKLTAEQWAAARRRWEGTDKAGFAWLREEVLAAFGDAPSRPAMQQMAAQQGWVKGGDPSEPLKPAEGQKRATSPAKAPPPAKKVTRAVEKATPPQPPKVTQPEDPPGEVADEVVDTPPTEQKRGPGRPTKYQPAFAREILDFFSKEPYTEVDVPQPSGLVKRQRMATDPPMLATFAKSIGVSVRTLNRWAIEVDDDTGKVRHPEFAEAFARAREFLEALLVRGGVLGLYDPRVVQFALKNLAGWADQPARASEVAPISKEELEATYIRDMEEAHASQDALDAARREWLLKNEGAV
jgi:hypothetical protein